MFKVTKPHVWRLIVLFGTLYGYQVYGQTELHLTETSNAHCLMISGAKDHGGARLSQFAGAKSDPSVFALGGLGDLVLALFEFEMHKQGFLHEPFLEMGPDYQTSAVALEKALAHALGTELFERMPWNVFTPTRYGRLIWEKSKTSALPPERIYLDSRGWLALAGDTLAHVADISKMIPRVQFAEKGAWKLWHDKESFVAASSAGSVLAGASCEKIPDTATLDTLLTELGAQK